MAGKLHRAIVKVHRVAAALFILAVLPAGYASYQGGDPPSPWVYAPVPFILVLLITGTYMLVRPWVLRRRAATASAPAA